MKKTPVVALFGSPNSGKTSLFNALTGGREKVGNYAGVTVERVTGKFSVEGRPVDLIDIPGLYSLRALSIDEKVAKEALTSTDRPDLVIFVLDSVNLERSLFLFSQTAQQGIPIIVALTMGDLARKEGRRIDLPEMEQLLQVPIVEIISHKGTGLNELRAEIKKKLGSSDVPEIDFGYPQVVEESLAKLLASPNRPEISAERVRELLLADDTDHDVAPDGPWKSELTQVREELFGGHLHPRTLDSQTRYSWAAKVVRACAEIKDDVPSLTLTRKIDAVLTHKVWGLLIFLGVMYLVFLSIYTFATPFMDWLDLGFGWIQDQVSPMLAGTPALQSLIVDGVIGGIGSAIVFLPQILILFAFISVLEGSGYLARASFLMDRALGWCGLTGRAFIPLLSSFACAIPGIMAARVMPDTRGRLAVIFVAPLMSCSARLPVYVLVIGAFVEPKFGPLVAGFALFVMHFIGLIFAVPVVMLLNWKVLKGARLPFLLELPRYQWPKPRDIGIMVVNRCLVFLKTAGTVIVAMSILIWATLYFPRSDAAFDQYKKEYAAQSVEFKTNISEDNFVAQRQRGDSILGRTGKLLEPVFLPAGFDWRLTTAILAAFPAREVVVSAMGILFSVGEDAEEVPLRHAMVQATWPDGKPLLNIWNAMGLMVFFALCCQCMATLAVIRKETNSWKASLAVFSYMTLLAYGSAVAINQIGRLFGA